MVEPPCRLYPAPAPRYGLVQQHRDTVKEGVFSLLKGDSPFHSRPARFSGTRRETTVDTGSRARISSRNESENFITRQWAQDRAGYASVCIALITAIH